MNMRMQLVRAAAALLIIGGVATAETLSKPATGVDCPFAKTVKPQRIMLLDPIQKHPTWIDAGIDSKNSVQIERTVDASHDAAIDIVTSS
jgi:hypothetical protein